MGLKPRPIEDKEPCFCGSGQKYKSCCKRNRKRLNSGDSVDKALSEGRHEDALLLERAALTEYRLKHEENTLFYAEQAPGSDLVRNFFRMDIRALSDIIESLMRRYEENGMQKAFLRVLERLADAIKDVRWEHQLTYLRTLWEMQGDVVPETFMRNFEAFDVEEIENPEILQMYLDVFSEQLGLSETLDITSRLLDFDRNPPSRLQYYLIRGSQLHVHGDSRGAIRELQVGIAEFEEWHDESHATGRTEYQYGQTQSFLAGLTEDNALAEQARDAFIRSLDVGGYNAAGKAMIYRCIGESHLAHAEWNEAEEAYRKSLEFEDDPEHWFGFVSLAKVLLRLGRLESAETALQNVVFDELPRPGKLDYAFTFALLAALKSELPAIKEALSMIEELPVKEPEFREQRDELRILLLKADSDSGTGSVKAAIKTRLWALVSFFNTYIMLKPNFFGLGLDLNQVVDDLSPMKQLSEERLPALPEDTTSSQLDSEQVSTQCDGDEESER